MSLDNLTNQQFVARFQSVRDNDGDAFRRYRFAPNKKFKAQYLNARNCTDRQYQEDYGAVEIRYCDNGYHGDSAPSLTFSSRTFFPQWPVA